MKVQVWADFRCAFCYIGKKHLEKAFEEMGKPLELEIMSFELDPGFIPTPGKRHYDTLVEARGTSSEEVKEMFGRVIDMAKDAGLNYDLERLIDANSFKAHKLLQLAKAKGKASEYSSKIFEAHFEKGLDIADDEVLAVLSEEAGLNEEEVRNVLNSNIYDDEVRQQEVMAQQMGINGVPFFIFDNKVGLSGAQPVEVMKEAVEYTENLDQA